MTDDALLLAAGIGIFLAVLVVLGAIADALAWAERRRARLRSQRPRYWRDEDRRWR